MTDVRIARALLSVSDKTGLVDFARGLADLTADGLRTVLADDAEPVAGPQIEAHVL